MTGRFLLEAAAVLAAAALCAAPTGALEPPDDLVAGINEAGSSAPASPVEAAAGSVLALEARFSDEGVEVTRAELLEAPLPRPSEGQPFRFRARGGDALVHEGSLPDPRVVRVEGGGLQVRSEGSTWIFVPADSRVSSLELVPTDSPLFNQFTAKLRAEARPMPRAQLIELGPVLERLCTGQPSREACFGQQPR